MSFCRKSSKQNKNKSALTNLEVSEMYRINKPELRGSVPPDNRIKMSSFIPKRAKSVSKEPSSSEDSTNSLTNPKSSNRFFSLSRRFPRLRFTSSSSTVIEPVVTSESQVPVKKEEKLKIRERALSPSNLFKNLRSRSPFAKSRAANPDSKVVTKPASAQLNVMTTSCYSTMSPTVAQVKPIETRSISCEFTENQSTSNASNIGVGEQNSVLPLANRAITTQRMKKVTLNKNESLVIEQAASTISADTVGDQSKSVKFKEPPIIQINSEPQQQPPKSKTEEQLINALDEAITSVRASSTLTPSSSFTSSLNEEDKKSKSEPANEDKPPKPPTHATTTTTTRVKFASVKARTIDVPDFLQQASSTASNKPITSILRRSETPPSSKTTSLRQASVESTESNSRDRESSIEKRLRISSSTSRPLMFSN
jgi:hypothetical protein